MRETIPESPADDQDDIVLATLLDSELVEQMHDDLYGLMGIGGLDSSKGWRCVRRDLGWGNPPQYRGMRRRSRRAHDRVADRARVVGTARKVKRGAVVDKLLQNAIDSIRVGVEDYGTGGRARSLASVRNLHAGLLLLAKWVLVKSVPNASEDDVIRVAYEPESDGSGGVRYVPRSGKQTIGLQDIHTRFERFGLNLGPEAKKRLNSLANMRNDIEHRYSSAGAATVQQTVSEAFVVASEMFRLGGIDPVKQLGDAWGVMLEVNEVNRKELEACWATFEDVEWRFPIRTDLRPECSNCHSELVEQEDPRNVEQARASGKCRACGEGIEAEAIVECLVRASFEWDNYVSVKETGEGVLFECPSCTRETYVGEADDNGELFGCLGCGYKLGRCGVCGTGLRPDDLYGDADDLCGYCGYRMSKDE